MISNRNTMWNHLPQDTTHQQVNACNPTTRDTKATFHTVGRIKMNWLISRKIHWALATLLLASPSWAENQKKSSNDASLNSTTTASATKPIDRDLEPLTEKQRLAELKKLNKDNKIFKIHTIKKSI